MNKLKFFKIPSFVNTALRVVNRYKIIAFVIVVAGVYGYVLLQISSLSNAQPTPDQISAQSDPIKTAHIDKNVVDQLHKLQDNSVSVQTLFDTARNNPFEEE